jgi:hypothetical protein
MKGDTSMTKTPMNMRLSDEARTLMKSLGQKLGLDETSVVEMAVRKLAEAEGVRIHENIYQQYIEAILCEKYQKKVHDITVSDGDTFLVFQLKPCSATDIKEVSQALGRWGRAWRDTAESASQSTDKNPYFFSMHSSEGSKAEENKETHEVKK